MSDRPTKGEMELERLQDALIEDVLSASDEEILSEAREDGLDPAAISKEMLSLLEAAELKVGKERMAAAKAGAAAARRLGSAAPADVSMMRAAAANDAEARRLTMAARNGSEQSERDLEGIAEDLAELGTIPPDPEKGPK
ncbi:MAG: hypothetical protein NVSMB18_19540 [Acetobacteraceae bacterium]